MGTGVRFSLRCIQRSRYLYGWCLRYCCSRRAPGFRTVVLSADCYRRERPLRYESGGLHNDHRSGTRGANEFFADLNGAHRATTVGLDELCFVHGHEACVGAGSHGLRRWRGRSTRRGAWSLALIAPVVGAGAGNCVGNCEAGSQGQCGSGEKFRTKSVCFHERTF